MWLFYNSLLILFFSVIFYLAIFVVEKIKSTNWFIKLYFSNTTKILMEGFIYGVVLISLNLLFENIRSTGIAFWLIGFFILVSSRESTIAAIAIAPSSIYYFFENHISSFTYSIYSIVFGMSILLLITRFFTSNFISKLITYSIISSITFILWIAIFFTNDKINLNDSVNKVIFTSLGAMIDEMIVFWFIKTSISANVLYQSINYSFSRYYRYSLKNKIIGERIVKNKINKGFYVVFNININSEDIDYKREVLETILKNLEFSLPNESVLFQGNKNQYGAFIPIYKKIKIDKLIDDNYNFEHSKIINFLRVIIEKQTTSYKLKNGNILKAKVFAGISVYGIQSNSLDKLEHDAMFALSYATQDNNNHIYVFDPLEYNARKKETKALEELEEVIELASLQLKYKSVYCEENINIVEFISTNDEDFRESLSDYIFSVGHLDVFNRYLSATAIKFSKNFNGSLAIPYSLKSLKDFNILKFKKRLNLLEWNINKIIFILDSSEIKRNKTTKNILNILKNSGARFGFSELTNNDKDLIEIYKPDFLFYKKPNKIIKNENIIITDINFESELEESLKYNLKYFAGDLLSSKTKAHIFSKQSKIYIEDIKKRGSYE